MIQSTFFSGKITAGSSVLHVRALVSWSGGPREVGQILFVQWDGVCIDLREGD